MHEVERVDFREIFLENSIVMQRASELLSAALTDVAHALNACLTSGRTILACGNGGSAASAQHLVAELVCRFQVDRGGLAAISLIADAATLTAIANDYGYASIFSRQVEAIAKPGDILIAISTSGNSANVIEAAKAARNAHCKVVALTGSDGGLLAAHSDFIIRAPSMVVARIQEVHDVCIHAIAEALERHACLESAQ